MGKDFECHIPPEARYSRVSPLPPKKADRSDSCDDVELLHPNVETKRELTDSPKAIETQNSSINKQNCDNLDIRQHLTPSPTAMGHKHQIHHPLPVIAGHNGGNNLGLIHNTNNNHLHLQQVVNAHAPVPAVLPPPRPTAPARASFMISDILGDQNSRHRDRCFTATKYDVTDSEGDSDCDQYENEVDVVTCNNASQSDEFHRGKKICVRFTEKPFTCLCFHIIPLLIVDTFACIQTILQTIT